MKDKTDFEQGLQDLIWIRERLNAELNHELTRSQGLADATAKLRNLNEVAHGIISETLLRIGVWQEETEAMPAPIDLPNIARPRPLQSENLAGHIYQQMNGLVQ